MPLPVWKKKAAVVWHVHGSVVIAVLLATISAGLVVAGLEWMFAQ